MSTTGFVGTIPAIYEAHLGPALFEPYAIDLAARVPPGSTVLELACGTGRVTKHLAAVADKLVATDLNAPMLFEAQRHVDAKNVQWLPVDAQELPFAAEQFDVVAMQFGLMFVPDKARAVAEMRRVLRPGGRVVLSTWDHTANNPATKLLHDLAMAEVPGDPPMFMTVPFSMPVPDALRAWFAHFARVELETVRKTSESPSAAHLAHGFVCGNPLHTQLVERNVDADAFEAKVAAALAEAYGDSPCRTPLSAHVVTAIV